MGKPRIRFQGYTDDWEQSKVGDFLTESRESGHKGDVAHKMTVKLWGKGVYEKNEAGSANTRYFIRHAGQFIYSKLDFLNCAFGVVPEELESLETTADVPAFDCDGVNPYFMFYTAIQPSFYEKNGIIADGSRKAKRIHADTFLDMPFFVPSLEEQNKIVNLLSGLDDLLTLHQRKCEETRRLKQYMLQKMFPQDGRCVPEIRFAGFTEDWEQRKLGEVYTERNERGNDSLQILSVSIHSGVSDGELDAENLGKTVRRSEDKSTYKHVYEGDLIFNMMRAWQGAIGVAKSEGMISPAYISAIPSENLYPLFMNYLLRRKEIVGQINNLSYGVTDFRKRLYWDSFVKVVCNIPSVEEQKKIAEYFDSLDHLITLHQRKLEILKKIKKYFLKKMFAETVLYSGG